MSVVENIHAVISGRAAAARRAAGQNVTQEHDLIEQVNDDNDDDEPTLINPHGQRHGHHNPNSSHRHRKSSKSSSKQEDIHEDIHEELDDDIHVLQTSTLVSSPFTHDESSHFHDSNQSQDQIQRLTTFPNASYNIPLQDRFRRELKFYFMSPIDKWRAKGRIPYKLFLQVVKIIIVTLQLTIFGISMSRYLTQQGNMGVSLRKIMLLNWDPIREVMSYPPAAGPFAVYDKHAFYEAMNHAIKQFANISNLSVGAFGYQVGLKVDDKVDDKVGLKDALMVLPNVDAYTDNQEEIQLKEDAFNLKDPTKRMMSLIHICQKTYQIAVIDPTNFTYQLDNRVVDKCHAIDNLYPPGDPKWISFDIVNYLKEVNFTIEFNRLIEAKIHLPLRTIYLNSVSLDDAPECFDVDMFVTFINKQHSGQVLVSLSAPTTQRECSGNLNDAAERRTFQEKEIINWLVIVLCSLSAFLCVRSLLKGQYLRAKAVRFFRKHFDKELDRSDKMEFIDGWIVMILANDVMIIIGSVVKVIMEHKSLHGYHYTYCSLLLGVGNLLVWCGLLRYLGFFHKYNILIITIKHSLPHVLRFLLCAVILYGGFCFCGWLVLGPYNLKFRSLSRTSECLFALMNGDDLFATFAITNTSSQLIWWFSRLYLYTFITLFIYVVLSLFIAIIMDAYETIKEYHQEGFPLSDLQRFIAQCQDSSSSMVYREDDNSLPNVFRDCWRRFKIKFFGHQERVNSYRTIN